MQTPKDEVGDSAQTITDSRDAPRYDGFDVRHDLWIEACKKIRNANDTTNLVDIYCEIFTAIHKSGNSVVNVDIAFRHYISEKEGHKTMAKIASPPIVAIQLSAAARACLMSPRTGAVNIK